MPRALLALLLPLLLATAARAEPQTVRVALGPAPEGAEALEVAATALHAVLYGLGALSDDGAVEVALYFGDHRGAAAGQMSAWLTDAGRWAGAKGKSDFGDALAAAAEGLPEGGHLVVLDTSGGKTLDRAARAALEGRRVTVLGDGAAPAGCADGARGRCHHVPLSSDVIGAAATAVERALGGIDGVWVTTVRDRVEVPVATLRLAAVVPGAKRPAVEGLDAARPLVGEAEERLVTGAVWAQPAAGAHALSLPADGSRAMVVGVLPRVRVVDCALAEGDAARWRFASIGPGWSDALAQRLRFEVAGRAALLPVTRRGEVTIPAEVAGEFSLTPLWVDGEVRRVIGPMESCRATPRMQARAVLSARHDDDAVVVRVEFRDPAGGALDPAAVLDAGEVRAGFAGDAAVSLRAVDGAAEARLPRPAAGTHVLEVTAPTSRALRLTGAALDVRVDDGGGGGGAPWWPGLLAAGVVTLAFLGLPTVTRLVQRSRPAPTGVVTVSVGGSPVMDRRLGPQTAFPALLVGVRDIPIANGDSLARAEVRWDGWRPMVVAIVMGKPDEHGRCRPRVEKCALSEATPFEFSNVRIEFIEHG